MKIQIIICTVISPYQLWKTTPEKKDSVVPFIEDVEWAVNYFFIWVDSLILADKTLEVADCLFAQQLIAFCFSIKSTLKD